MVMMMLVVVMYAQGRLPVRVQLQGLTQKDLLTILQVQFPPFFSVCCACFVFGYVKIMHA